MPIAKRKASQAYVPLAVREQDEPSNSTDFVAIIERYKSKVRNPKTAIRAKCVECSGGSLKEVSMCRVFKCALYPFRMGENPFHLKTIKRLAASGDEIPDGPESDNDDDEEELPEE